MRKVYAHSGFKLARFGPQGIRAFSPRRALAPCGANNPFLLGGGAGRALVALRQPFGEVIGTADVLTVNEDLWIGDLRRYCSQGLVRVVLIQNQLFELDAGVMQETLGLDAEGTAFTREDSYVVRQNTFRREIGKHRISVGHAVRVAWLFRFNEHLLDHTISNQHGVTPGPLTETKVILVDKQAHLFRKLTVAVGQKRHAVRVLAALPFIHDEGVIDGNANNLINIIGVELRRKLVVSRYMR